MCAVCANFWQVPINRTPLYRFHVCTRKFHDRNICTFLPAGNNFELWPLGIKSKHQMYAVNANVLASSNQRDIPLPDFYFAADSFMIERYVQYEMFLSFETFSPANFCITIRYIFSSRLVVRSIDPIPE